MLGRSALTFGAGVLLGCSSGGAGGAPTTTSQRLSEGTAASVAGDAVSVVSVARIAERQGLAPQRALELALSDALFAAQARASTPAGVASSIERAAAARALLETLATESERRGPPTAEELDAIVRERWTELDRPAGVRTTHLVVQVKEPSQDGAARALAESMASAVAPAVTSDDFERLANAVPPGAADVKVEKLPVVSADGRSFELKEGRYVPTGGFDPDFARAANALETPGQLSPIVRTKFGYHVIRLAERVPASALDPTQRANLLGPEALTRRASRARTELLEKLRAGAPIEVDRAVDDLTARVEVAP
ncbi:MAG TPA: peptidyl-prolyl cis-trans isomerase [Polyangiaceae bacterium]